MPNFPRNLLIALGALVVTVTLCLSVAALPNDTPERESAPTTTADKVTCAESHDLDEGVSCSRVAKDYTFAVWFQAWQHGQLVSFYDTVWANHLEEQARLAAASRSYGPSGAGGECGGATNGADAFIQRESGGSSTVWNSSGSSAWGCYQVIRSTWDSSCSDLGVHGQADAAAQAECASRLPLSAWASSGPTG